MLLGPSRYPTSSPTLTSPVFAVDVHSLSTPVPPSPYIHICRCAWWTQVRRPRALLREFGLQLPDTVGVRVHDSTADLRYMVLPMRPRGTEGWGEAELAATVTRDSMIGVGLPRTEKVKIQNT